MNLGLVDASRTQPNGMQSANSKVWWRRDNELGPVFQGLGPLVPVKGDINATAQKDILTIIYFQAKGS